MGGRSPFFRLRLSSHAFHRADAQQIEAAMRDPAEYIPSRIRHQTREVRAVLDYIDRAESP